MADDNTQSHYADVEGFSGLPDDDENLGGWKLEHLQGQVNSLINNTVTQDSEVDAQRGRAYLQYLGTGRVPAAPKEVLYQDRIIFATIERMQRKILGVFNAESKVCRFSPLEEYSAEQADMDTEIANKIFFQDNKGIDILKQAIQNGLIAKTGVIREYIDETYETIEEEIPLGLSEELLNQALNQRIENNKGIADINTDYEVLEDGTVTGTYTILLRKKEVKFVSIKPEDLLVPTDTVDLETAKAITIRIPTTGSELLAMGIDREKIEGLGRYDSIANFQNNTQLGRDSLDNIGQSYSNADTGSWENSDLEVYESYLRTVDAMTNDDMMVRIVHGGEQGDVLFAERVEDGMLPIFTWCPYPIAGRFYGQSVADLLSHHQTARTILMRSVLNNTASSNTRRLMVKVSNLIDKGDIIQNKLSGIVRVKEGFGLDDTIKAMPQYTIAPETFTAFDMLEKSAERDSGSPRSSSGVDETMLEGNKAASLVHFLTLQGTEAVAEMAREVADKLVAPLMYRLVFRHYQTLEQDIDERLLKDSMQVAVALTPEERTVQAQKMLEVHDKMVEYEEKTPEISTIYPPENRVRLLRDACLELLPSARAYLDTIDDEGTLKRMAEMEANRQKAQQKADEAAEFEKHVAQTQLDIASQKNVVDANRIANQTAQAGAELKAKSRKEMAEVEIKKYEAETKRMKVIDEKEKDDDNN